MRLALKLHPGSRCEAVTQIQVDAVRPDPGTLLLRYIVGGTMSDLRLPPVTAPTHTDELWRHTCVEAFLSAPTGTAYYEFNFAPSMQWAAYRFSGYRSGMMVASEISPPRVETHLNGEDYELQATVELAKLPGLPIDEPWRLGLCAVIEEVSGRTSYWALTHPPGKPDFHHSDCFAHEIAAARHP
jgi:hypothetical protein